MPFGERFSELQDARKAFFDLHPLGVMLLDRGGTILEVNPQQEINSGVSAAALVGRRAIEVFSRVVERYGLAPPVKALLEENQPFRVQIDHYEPQFLKQNRRGWMWGFVLVPGRYFVLLTEFLDNVRLQAAPEIVGASERMDLVQRFIERAAGVNATVLLCGESGTGKELVAHALHARSARARNPFLALNCAALPGPLLESALFGAERGAFTGADRRTKGYFEAAEGGTLLLDEIGETSLEFQSKLLRVLQDGVVTRLGGTEAIRTNVRVICATNRDLDVEVAARRFREDLYYRINILRLELPPLRERREDIPLLTQHFLREFAGKHQIASKHVDREVLDAFLAYRWPGNVRELANVLESACVSYPDQVIRLEHLPNRVRESALLHAHGHLQPHPYREALRRFRQEYMRHVIDFAGGDVQKAARLAGVNQSTLYRLGTRRGASGRAAAAPEPGRPHPPRPPPKAAAVVRLRGRRHGR